MHNLVTNELDNFETDFKPRFQEIHTKTLVIWGKNDEMLHVSGAKFLEEHLKSVDVIILEKCGHIIQFDKPSIATRHLIRFYKNHLLKSI